VMPNANRTMRLDVVDGSESVDRLVRRKRAGGGPRTAAHPWAPIRPQQRLGRRPAASQRRERVSRLSLLERVRRMASRAHRWRLRRDQSAIRLRLRRLPPPSPHRSDRLPVPRRRMATQGHRARGTRAPAAPGSIDRLTRRCAKAPQRAIRGEAPPQRPHTVSPRTSPYGITPLNLEGLRRSLLRPFAWLSKQLFRRL
jgi:hypothetical protein